jgi:outer membrane scaffolding protein for murein synthesis (MipA/OmpV family)
VVEGPVVKAAAAPASAPRITEPLWELGAGIAAVRFPDYRGSDQSSTYALPLPFFTYRGQFLRADRDGARAIFFAGQRIVVDLSLGASVPIRSHDNDARQGMPDLAGTLEIGPSVNVELWQVVDHRIKLELRLPVREAITLQTPPKTIGTVFSPNLALDVLGLGGRWNLGALVGPLYADRHYHEYFYGVAPPFATGMRPAYEAPGGYAGWRATTSIAGRVGSVWLGGFVRYDDLHGAVFAPSPLVRRENAFTAGFGVSWIFAVSGQRVVVDD